MNEITEKIVSSISRGFSHGKKAPHKLVLLLSLAKLCEKREKNENHFSPLLPREGPDTLSWVLGLLSSQGNVRCLCFQQSRFLQEIGSIGMMRALWVEGEGAGDGGQMQEGRF